jgi:hypothetical protein
MEDVNFFQSIKDLMETIHKAPRSMDVKTTMFVCASRGNETMIKARGSVFDLVAMICQMLDYLVINAGEQGAPRTRKDMLDMLNFVYGHGEDFDDSFSS